MTNTEDARARLSEALATFQTSREEIGRLTLCGSTRFRAEYELWNRRLSLAGFLVYSVSCFGHSGDPLAEEEKERLDRVHLAKIDASHAIVVINPGGYVGDSTSREIIHARATGKPVYFTDEGCPTVYQLRTGPDGAGSLRYRAFGVPAREEGRRPAPPPPGVERERIARIIRGWDLPPDGQRIGPGTQRAIAEAYATADAVIAALPREGVRESAPTVVSGAWKDVSLSRLERVRAHRAEFGSDLKAAVDAVDAEAERQRIAALQPPHPDPAGGGEFVLVPREPTEEMIAAAVKRLGLPWREIQRMLEGYRAMIAAAPGDSSSLAGRAALDPAPHDPAHDLAPGHAEPRGQAVDEGQLLGGDTEADPLHGGDGRAETAGPQAVSCPTNLAPIAAAAPGDQKCSGPDGPPGLGSPRNQESGSVEPSSGGWRPIERAPGWDHVLVVDAKGRRLVAFRHHPSSHTDEFLSVPGRWQVKPVAWQPLPAAPAERDPSAVAPELGSATHD